MLLRHARRALRRRLSQPRPSLFLLRRPKAKTPAERALNASLAEVALCWLSCALCDCIVGAAFTPRCLQKTNQANVLTLVKLQETQQVTRSIRRPDREERREDVFGSGANQVNHGLRFALRSHDGDTKSMANQDQAGKSLLNVLQMPSSGIIYQGNKEVVEESRRPKGDGLHKIAARFQQERTWPGEMNKKEFVQEGLLVLLLVLEEGNAEYQIGQRITWFCARMRDDHVRRTRDMECCTPVPTSCCRRPKWWYTKGKANIPCLAQLML